MKQAVLVFAIALVITLAIGPAVINYLRKMKFGQKILEIGPKWHMNKQNIPTMGGFMFIIGIAAAVIIGNIVMGEISVSSLAVLGLAVAYGAVGLVDDYAKIKKKENAGLTPKQKLVLQILVAGVFILVLFLGSSGLPQLWIPFTGISFSWPWPLYIVIRGVRYRRRGQRRQSDRRHRRSGSKRYAAGCHLLRVRRLPPRRHGRCDLFGGTRGCAAGLPAL